jgi:hypothetical protein
MASLQERNGSYRILFCHHGKLHTFTIGKVGKDVGQKKWASPPDPFKIAQDNVAGVRLYESRQDRQMAIKFENKPSQPVIDKMHEEG